MAAPTFVDLQGFIVGKNFVVKEAAVLRNGSVLSHYIFTCPIPWHTLTKSENISLRSDLVIMAAPTFVDLQGFIVGKNFVVKEAAVLRNGSVLSHYIFTCPVPWYMLTKSERCQVLWLIKNHHGLSWNDGHVSYWNSKRDGGERCKGGG
ncbi:hypothetical protein EAG_04559 [Camponotus floridanus]|uniref:Uncharacterized protein n=1 Tax=Camponotus floridanus TaxID=104421 RepID=E2ASN1_CAMFO|nr:hypothetical protein EAG_04559 [Camponotus floridanus]